MNVNRWERVPSSKTSKRAHSPVLYKGENSKGANIFTPTDVLDLVDKYVQDDDDDDDDSLSTTSVESSSENFSSHHDRLESKSYPTLVQTDFVSECLMGDMQTLYVAHVFDESEKCAHIDNTLNEMSKKYPKVAFRRIDGRKSNFVTKELSLSKFPAVVVLIRRKVRGRLDHFGESDYFTMDGECRMLQVWVKDMIAKYLSA